MANRLAWDASDEDVKLEALACGGRVVHVPLDSQTELDQPDTARVAFPWPNAPVRFATIERYRRTSVHA